MNITLEKAKDNIGLVKIIGRVDSSNEAELKTKFQEFLEEYRYFVLDCSLLEFIDSSGLGALLTCLKNANNLGGNLCIANLQSKPAMLFEITRAHKVFNVFDDVDSAIVHYFPKVKDDLRF